MFRGKWQVILKWELKPPLCECNFSVCLFKTKGSYFKNNSCDTVVFSHHDSASNTRVPPWTGGQWLGCTHGRFGGRPQRDRRENCGRDKKSGGAIATTARCAPPTQGGLEHSAHHFSSYSKIAIMQHKQQRYHPLLLRHLPFTTSAFSGVKAFKGVSACVQFVSKNKIKITSLKLPFNLSTMENWPKMWEVRVSIQACQRLYFG